MQLVVYIIVSVMHGQANIKCHVKQEFYISTLLRKTNLKQLCVYTERLSNLIYYTLKTIFQRISLAVVVQMKSTIFDLLYFQSKKIYSVRNIPYIKQSLSDYLMHTAVLKDLLADCGQQGRATKCSSSYDIAQSTIHKSATEISLK